MDVRVWEAQLRAEGFAVTYEWEDGPGVFYPDHLHSTTTAHVILAGEMTVASGGKTQVCKVGDRFDVPAGAVHSARMGPQGCRYLIGEK